MVSKLDQSVGEVVAALQRTNLLENSIIIFLSDNGAANHQFMENWGSNYPLRGVSKYVSFNSFWIACLFILLNLEYKSPPLVTITS